MCQSGEYPGEPAPSQRRGEDDWGKGVCEGGTGGRTVGWVVIWKNLVGGKGKEKCCDYIIIPKIKKKERKKQRKTERKKERKNQRKKQGKKENRERVLAAVPSMAKVIKPLRLS